MEVDSLRNYHYKIVFRFWHSRSHVTPTLWPHGNAIIQTSLVETPKHQRKLRQSQKQKGESHSIQLFWNTMFGQGSRNGMAEVEEELVTVKGRQARQVLSFLARKRKGLVIQSHLWPCALPCTCSLPPRCCLTNKLLSTVILVYWGKRWKENSVMWWKESWMPFWINHLHPQGLRSFIC